MAYQGDGIDWGNATAAADLSGNQYYAVNLNSTGGVILATDANPAIGILQNEPTTGQAAAVRVGGVSKAVAGASFDAGVRVCAFTDGKINLADAGDEVLGVSLTASGADGDVVTILVLPTQETLA